MLSNFPKVTVSSRGGAEPCKWAVFWSDAPFSFINDVHEQLLRNSLARRIPILIWLTFRGADAKTG